MNDFETCPVPPSRREFGKNLALLAATPLALNAPEPAPAQGGASAAVNEALFEIVRQRYAKFLTPAQLDEVKRGITRNQASAAMLKQVKLTNSDEPAFSFRGDLP